MERADSVQDDVDLSEHSLECWSIGHVNCDRFGFCADIRSDFARALQV